MDDIGSKEHQDLGSGPEAQESANAARKCQKNPGHEGFIPIYEFTKQHLPKPYQWDEDFAEYIKTQADLVVRVRVTAKSPGRPDMGYYGAKRGIRTGSGYVSGLEPDREPCRCLRCVSKPDGSGKSWRFGVVTANHVVFDDTEATVTSVNFFFDSEESRTDGRMKTVDQGAVIYSHGGVDYCRVMFSTCDTELGGRLEKLERRARTLQAIVKERYASRMPLPRNIVWIVSHPHGMAKHISLGQIKGERKLNKPFQFSYSYSAATCPGCSGAMVCKFGESEDFRSLELYDILVHCKGNIKNGWNVGCNL